MQVHVSRSRCIRMVGSVEPIVWLMLDIPWLLVGPKRRPTKAIIRLQTVVIFSNLERPLNGQNRGCHVSSWTRLKMPAAICRRDRPLTDAQSTQRDAGARLGKEDRSTSNRGVVAPQSSLHRLCIVFFGCAMVFCHRECRC